MSEHIITSRQDGILEICLSRPDKKNAITAEMYGAMAIAVADAERDPAVRVILFRGEGDSFTAGNDLKDFLANPPQSEEAPVVLFMKSLAAAQKIVIAAVQGNAVGIGTTLLFHCDLVVAAQGAKFILPFVNLGLVPEFASSLILPQLVGHRRASEVLLLGAPLDAATAQEMGIVNRVVEETALLETARALARQVASRAPAAVRLTKKLLKSDAATVPARIAEEMRHFQTQLQSAELREAVAAFFEKRAPDFSSM